VFKNRGRNLATRILEIHHKRELKPIIKFVEKLHLPAFVYSLTSINEINKWLQAELFMNVQTSSLSLDFHDHIKFFGTAGLCPFSFTYRLVSDATPANFLRNKAAPLFILIAGY
jgi:hypothetical protein